MRQEDEATRPRDTAPVSVTLRPSADAWASLSTVDDDLDVAAAALSQENDAGRRREAAEIAAVEAESDEIDEVAALDEAAILADDEASRAAEANLAAVEAAADEAAFESARAFALRSRGGAFTIPLLCAGVAIIAACLLIPQADANRRLVYERATLQADLEAVEAQVATNDEFLRIVTDDPNLAERLAQRQMRIIRKGNEVLSLKSDGDAEMSPFQLTAVPPAAALAPYEPHGGFLAGLCYNPKSRLYLMGLGLMATAAGLVLGFGPRSEE